MTAPPPPSLSAPTRTRDASGISCFFRESDRACAARRTFPDRITPQYNLVSFSTVPYVEAQRRGREFDLLLDRIIAQFPPASLNEFGDERWKAKVIEVAAPLLL